MSFNTMLLNSLISFVSKKDIYLCLNNNGFKLLNDSNTDGYYYQKNLKSIYVIEKRNNNIINYCNLEYSELERNNIIWNEIPQKFSKSNIIYIFNNKLFKENILFISELSYGIENLDKIEKIYNETNNYFKKCLENENINKSMSLIQLEIIKRLNHLSITEEQAKEYTKKTFEFLESIKSFASDTIKKEKSIVNVSKSNII